MSFLASEDCLYGLLNVASVKFFFVLGLVQDTTVFVEFIFRKGKNLELSWSKLVPS